MARRRPAAVPATLADLPPLKDGRCRLMGLDLGDKTIGVALSDPTWSMATPLTTVTRTSYRKDEQVLVQLIREWDVGGLAIGLPVNMDGSDGPRAQLARSFRGEVTRGLEIAGVAMPVVLWDERWSTQAMERHLIDTGDVSRARRDQVIDKLAAAFILQGLLDRLRHLAAEVAAADEAPPAPDGP